MEWISVEDKLPNNGEKVLVYCGNYYGDKFHAVVTFEKGISLDEREKMKNGELHFEMIEGTHYDGNLFNPIHTTTERWKVIKPQDEYGNNEKPYIWSDPPSAYFGQVVTHWMPLPSPPIF